MKKKRLLPAFIHTLFLSSPLLLSGCQGIEQLFTDSPDYSYRSSGPGYDSRSARPSAAASQGGSSSAASSSSYTTTPKVTANPASSSDSSSQQTTTTRQETTATTGSKPTNVVPLTAPTVGE
ncbi:MULTISPECIES: hypothetical protein [unclassified Legionella]|uniref:hypothetical protein n=1 Tax=unclassified Legionella TaxID=2622702 RepID=UPI001055B9FD|nr:MULTISPECIES: hypothetical protein [unclassified Legionella]MDI9819003.1 hypothetical protein [Legionella sp. PL877]